MSTKDSYNSQDEDKTSDIKVLEETVYDLIACIRDPEKTESLEELNVVSESGVVVRKLKSGRLHVSIEFVPTVPHCTLASLIGLSIRTKLESSLLEKCKQKRMTEKLTLLLNEIPKIDINIRKGTHDTADEINKQINDKERISAAMENPNLQKLVQECIDDSHD